MAQPNRKKHAPKAKSHQKQAAAKHAVKKKSMAVTKSRNEDLTQKLDRQLQEMLFMIYTVYGHHQEPHRAK